MNSAKRSYQPPENLKKTHHSMDDDDIDVGGGDGETTRTSEANKSTLFGDDSADGESGSSFLYIKKHKHDLSLFGTHTTFNF